MGRKGSVVRKLTTVELSVETQFNEALRMLGRMGVDKKKAMRRILSGIGTSARAKVKRAYKSFGLEKHSGDLYKSITRKVVKSGKGVIIEAKARTSDTNLFYGYAIAKGAKITAKNGEWLTFQKDGKWIKKHEVKLPERDFVAKPVKDYLQSTAFKERFDALVQKEIDRVEKETTKK